MPENYIETADVITVATIESARCVLLVERAWPPFEGHWALPGGHLDPGETAIETAARELIEETNVPVAPYVLTCVGVYDTPGRDPRGPYRSTAYRVALNPAPTPVAADDARTARWIPIDELGELPLAFDHRAILTDALTAMR